MSLTIKEYNQYLIDNKINLDIDEYFKIIKNQYYSNEHINEKCLNLFLNSIYKKRFIITQMDLLKYNIILNDSCIDILNLIIKNKLQKNIDYKVKHVDPELTPYNLKEYKFTLIAFIKCLSLTKNNYEYKRSIQVCADILHYYNCYIDYDNVQSAGSQFPTLSFIVIIITIFVIFYK